MKNKSSHERLKTAIDNINAFYDNGKSTCVLRSLSLDSGMELFEKELRGIMMKMD